jgi:hypothetical protein
MIAPDNPVRVPKWARQHDLFDVPIKGHHALTTFIGGLYEMLVASMLDADVLGTSSMVASCPDAVIQRVGAVLEVKASSFNNYFKLYRHQYDRYALMTKERNWRVYYAFVTYKAPQHMFKRLGEPTVSNAVNMLAKFPSYVFVVDLSVVLRWVSDGCIHKWGRPGGECPEYLTEFMRIYPKDMLNNMNNVRDMLTRHELQLSDYIITTTQKDGVVFSGVKFAPIDLCIVNLRGSKRCCLTLDDFELLKSWQMSVNSEDTPF